MDDDGRQTAYESVVLHSNLLCRDRDLCLQFRKNILLMSFTQKIFSFIKLMTYLDIRS